MTKEGMYKVLNNTLKDLNKSNKDDIIRICVINQVKSMVDNYENLNNKDKAFVDGFFLQ